MRRFIVLCHARTGSSLVHEAVRRHPEAIMHGEVLSEQLAVRRDDWAIEGRYLGDDEDGAAFLREVVFAPSRPVAALGFKLMYVHARDGRAANAWSYLAENKDIFVIHLTRADLLACLVSLEVAIRSAQWRVEVGSKEEVRSVVPFALEPARCASYFETTAARIQWGADLFADHPRLELEYQRDVVVGFEPAMERVFDALGLRARPIEKALVKQARRAPSEQLSNYRALADHFAGSPWARFFSGE